MINEVHLIVRRGQNIEGDFEEPSDPFAFTSNKIGVNFFDGLFSLVGLPITIIAADLTEYDGGLINAVNFEAVWPGLYDINFDTNIILPVWNGATFRIGAVEETYLDLYPLERP